MLAFASPRFSRLRVGLLSWDLVQSMDCSTVWPLHQLSSPLTVSTQRETEFSFETVPTVPRHPVFGFSPFDGPSFEAAYWLAGLLHPAAGHGVRRVFDLFSLASSITSR